MTEARSQFTKAYRALTTTVALVAVLLVTVVGVAGPAAADGNGGDGGGDGGNSDITLLTSTLPAMHAGQIAWVSTIWQGANVDANNFQMTATSSKATISYPTNTATYSSLYGSSFLYSAATDFAALKVRINDNATGTVRITLNVRYGLKRNPHDSNPWESTDMSREITLAVTPVTGAAVGAVTTSLGPLAHGASAWQQFSVTGRLPGVTALTAQVTAPAGISIAYPNDATSTGPSQGSTLDVDTTDFFAFKTTVDPSVAPGSYSLTITLHFGSGSQQAMTVPLVVT